MDQYLDLETIEKDTKEKIVNDKPSKLLDLNKNKEKWIHGLTI